MSKMMELRRNADLYSQICHRFVSLMVGKSFWNNNVHFTVFSDLASVADEAFTLLILMNNQAVWNEMAITGNTKRNLASKSLWTKKVQEYQKYPGWDNEGIAKYNELCREVEKDREERGSIFDRHFKPTVDPQEEKTRCRRRSEKIIDPIVAAFDLSNDEDDGEEVEDVEVV